MSVADPLPRRPARLDVIETVWQSALMTVRRSLRGRRFVATASVLVLLPLALALLSASTAPPERQVRFFYGMLSLLHFGLVVPVVALTQATAFPWPEAEEGTLTYWFTAPVWRWAVHLGRYLAAWFVGALAAPLSVVALAVPLEAPAAAELPTVARSAVAATLLAYPAYLALFWLLSTVFRRGLVVGVIFILLENSLALFTGNIARLTVIFYVRSHMWPAVPEAARDVAAARLRLGEPATVGTSVAVFAAVMLAALTLSLVLVQRIEYRSRTEVST